MRDQAHPRPPLAHPGAGGAAGTFASDPALPRWITPALIASTLATFEPYYTEPLSKDDAIEMLLSAGNLFRILSGDDHEHEKNRRETEGGAG